MDALLRACSSVNAMSGKIIQFCAFTGCRPGTLSILKWSDVKFPQRLLVIPQDNVRPPVDLSDQALELLIRLKKESSNPTGQIFAGITDYQIKKARNVMKMCVKALMKDGHEDLLDMTDLKSLRHYFASVCVMRGIDFKTIALWLGHGDGGALVADVYWHLRPDHTKSAMAGVQFSMPRSEEKPRQDSSAAQGGQEAA